MPTLTGKLQKVKRLPVILRILTRLYGHLDDFKIIVGGVRLYKRDWKNEEESHNPKYDIEELRNHLGEEVEVEYEELRTGRGRHIIEMLHFRRSLRRKYLNITDINFP